MHNYDRASEISQDVIQQAKNLGRAWIRDWAFSDFIKAKIRSGQRGDADLDKVVKEINSMGVAIPEDAKIELDLVTGKLESALKQSVELCSISSDRGDKTYYLDSLELQLRVLLKMQKPEEAIQLADKGIKMAEEMSYLPMLWRIRAIRAQALEGIGDRSEAAQEYESAARIIHRLAGNIPQAELRQTFLSDPQVYLVIERAKLYS